MASQKAIPKHDWTGNDIGFCDQALWDLEESRPDLAKLTEQASALLYPFESESPDARFDALGAVLTLYLVACPREAQETRVEIEDYASVGSRKYLEYANNVWNGVSITRSVDEKTRQRVSQINSRLVDLIRDSKQKEQVKNGVTTIACELLIALCTAVSA